MYVYRLYLREGIKALENLGEIYTPSRLELKSFYISEWKRYYCQPEICDGTQWDLTIKFTNEIKVLKYGGSNYFPYNFAKFEKFIKNLFKKGKKLNA